MHSFSRPAVLSLIVLALLGVRISAQEHPPLKPMDLFDLEYAEDPQLSPDGRSLVFVRKRFDVVKDRTVGRLWIRHEGRLEPLTSPGSANQSSPRWCPNKKRLLFIESVEGKAQLFVHSLDSGKTLQISHFVERGPSQPSWSFNGGDIAFLAFVPKKTKPFVTMPKAPKGAKWAEPARVITSMHYRRDGGGFVKEGTRQLFVMKSTGGAVRQVTQGDVDLEGPLCWDPKGRFVIAAGDPTPDDDPSLRDTEILKIDVASGKITPLTDRRGPDRSPALHPTGKTIAYVGYDERRLGHQVAKLYSLDLESGKSRCLSEKLDRSISAPSFAPDFAIADVFARFDDHGKSCIARFAPDGSHRVLCDDLGGTTLGRPYPSGSFSVGQGGRVAYTQASPSAPAEIATLSAEGKRHRFSAMPLNRQLLPFRSLGAVEEIRIPSKADGKEIQGWIVKPPHFDPSKRHPLILEIHGGPFANYGPRFSMEMQLYAAAGYLVLYMNPRGSTSYGEDFGNLIHHAYPSQDYDDLMSGVDHLIERKLVDPQRLYVTGGSGGGVLTAWIVGKTDRFRAAVVAKPVINWFSFVLTADHSAFFCRTWFPALPWEDPEHYWKRSPISLVAKVKTPTMLLTGEADRRTPISETEQYYQALRLRGVDTMMVRIPGASHGIARRPSRLISKVLHVLKWFETHPAPKGK